jgi:hypothetical protein
MFFCDVLRPLEAPAPELFWVCVLCEAEEVDEAGPVVGVGVTISTAVLVMVEVTCAPPTWVTMTVVWTLVVGLGVAVVVGVVVVGVVVVPAVLVGVVASVVVVSAAGGVLVVVVVGWSVVLVSAGVFVVGRVVVVCWVFDCGAAVVVLLSFCRLSMTLSWFSMSSSRPTA